MKPVSSIVILAGLAASVAACSVQDRTYYPRQAYAPATTTYYSTDLAIEAVPGVTASNNIAVGSGNPLGCLNVVCT